MYFDGPSIPDAYRQIAENVRIRILGEPDSFILATTTDELVEYYFSAEHYSPVIVDPERTESAEHRKEVRLIPAHERDEYHRELGDFSMECESIVVHVPIIPNIHLRALRSLTPSSRSMSWTPGQAIWGNDFIGFSLDIKGYGFNKEAQQIKNDVQFQKERIYEWINAVAFDVEKENNALKQQIRKLVDERKQKLEADKGKIASLMETINIPLRRKEDEVVKRVQLDTKPLVKRIRPNPKTPENYQIDRESVLDIIQILENQGRQFEKTPKTFENSGEEDLRNIFLVNLNTVFQGKATGETFSNQGKTDIYLAIDKGNILVCECKIWGGQKLYGETIDQLMGYLIWRQNYGILITFVRNKDFSKTLAEAEGAIQGHSSYKGGFHKISTTHFMSHHVLPSDAEKSVELHHLFYHLHVK